MLPSSVISAIHSSGRQLVLAVTGGGSGAASALLEIPGASRSILEARVPYAYPALVEWLGGEPDQACSEPTARAMAMAAWMRARILAPDADPCTLLGVGATASLASDRPKRGDHRLFVAVQTAESTHSFALIFPDKSLTRAAEEEASTSLILAAIAIHCGVDEASIPLPFSPPVIQSRTVAPRSWPELLLGITTHVMIPPSGLAASAASQSPRLIFPGAFNPPHEGHLKMAAIAEARLGAPLAWELSIRNVDKPPLDFSSIARRVADLQRDSPSRVIILTAAPTFREKAALFPGATFVVGTDTVARIGEDRYYGGSALDRDEALTAVAAVGCRFLVFGREVDGRFATLSELSLPTALAAMCDEVPASAFREDVSSKELRERQNG